MTFALPYSPGDPGSLATPTPPVLSITEDYLVDVIKAFLQGALGTDMPVYRGQDNRVPQPRATDYIIVTPTFRRRLSTNRHDLDRTNGRQSISRSVIADVQLDFYGPGATDNTERATMLFRDVAGCDAMAGTGVQPLYCGDGRQAAFLNGEQQYEGRWIVQATLQINPAISTNVQFADSVDLTLIEADR